MSEKFISCFLTKLFPVCSWTPPANWTHGLPNVYFPLDMSREFTLLTGAGTVVADKDSVLVPGVVSFSFSSRIYKMC